VTRKRRVPRPNTDLATLSGGEPAALTAELAEQVAKETKPCSHCGGRHVRACPRVKRMAWHPGGALAEVEFWSEWSDAHVLWDDELDSDPPNQATGHH